MTGVVFYSNVCMYIFICHLFATRISEDDTGHFNCFLTTSERAAVADVTSIQEASQNNSDTLFVEKYDFYKKLIQCSFEAPGIVIICRPFHDKSHINKSNEQ